MVRNINHLIEMLEKIGQAVTVYITEKNRIIAVAHSKERHIEADRQSKETQISTAFRALTQEYSNESEQRQTLIECALVSVNDELNSIPDPHWHRMRTKYYDKAQQDVSENYSTRSPEELLAELENLLQKLFQKTQKLRNAFVPPGAANTIGFVIRPYRKNIYQTLARYRERILRCAEAIYHATDIDEKVSLAETVKRTKQEELDYEIASNMEAIPLETNASLENLTNAFVRVLNYYKSNGCFDQQAITIGNLEISGLDYSVISRLPVDFAHFVTVSGLSIPLSVSQIDSSILLVSYDQYQFSSVFTSIALDILKVHPSAKICFADVDGMGSTYPALSKPSDHNNVQIWRTEEDLSRGLDQCGKIISEIYANVLRDSYADLNAYNKDHPENNIENTYIFIENVTSSIPERNKEIFRRIVNNGKRAGVYLIMSIGNDAVVSNQEKELVRSIVDNSKVFMTREGFVDIAEGATIRLPHEIDRSQIEEVCERIHSLNSTKTVIPLGPALPLAQNWQKKSSENCIEVCIGVDQRGNSVFLRLSEDKPYAMIIGDVDSGKSSLLHSIIIQIMANYDASEVKIAIGDFKDGAEFNIYASSQLQPIETVMDNEDPDAMASFLQFYVKEMHRRQQLFEQLEAYSNRLIRKYESYRSVWSACGYLTPEMPRLLIVIDEFQSLFENTTGTASLLSELVRKGRTYGIHIIMASQRAVSDNPRNSFSGDLKNYFTSRFVFKSPQAAARTMLSERCADTGKENTGISKASLLAKGHVIYNSYMGQTEEDNQEVQCFYANDALITKMCEVITRTSGYGQSILLRRNDVSRSAPNNNGNEIMLGVSPCLRKDYGEESSDKIKDDITVSLAVDTHGQNIICSGPDDRVVASVAMSVLRYVATKDANYEIHLFGKNTNKLIGLLSNVVPGIMIHQDAVEIREELARQRASKTQCVNVFAELPDFVEFAQASSSLRTSPESELLREVITNASSDDCFNIIYGKYFRTIRTMFPFIVSSSSIVLLSVGDSENIRNATADKCRLVSSDFDSPRKDSIKAYYYNKDSEKLGKVILYQI